MNQKPGIMTVGEAKCVALCTAHVAFSIGISLALFAIQAFDIFAVWLLFALLSIEPVGRWAKRRWLQPKPMVPCHAMNRGTRALCHLRRGHVGPHAAWLESGTLRYWGEPFIADPPTPTRFNPDLETL